MANFKDLGLSVNESFTAVPIGETELSVRNYLPIDKKAQMIRFVIDGALDQSTGCFSPIRTEVYFSIALCAFYADISFDENDLMVAGQTYDALEQSDVIKAVIGAIPQGEFEFICDLVKDTTEDIARYNSSAAGIIQSMSSNAGDLGEQVTELLEKIQNKEGIETLSVIKDMVGTD